jgi:hypothetical protein
MCPFLSTVRVISQKHILTKTTTSRQQKSKTTTNLSFTMSKLTQTLLPWGRPRSSTTLGVSKKKQKAMTLTFGEVAENGPGMERIGQRAKEGFQHADLLQAITWFETHGVTCRLIDLCAALPVTGPRPPAWALVAYGGIRAFGVHPDEMLAEHGTLPLDKKQVFRHGNVAEVKNKRARHNLCYAAFTQKPDIPNLKGTVVNFTDVPLLNSVRGQLPAALGHRAVGLNCELNVYYDTRKTGIRMHGDSERKKVVAVRLATSIPLDFHWFQGEEPIGRRVKIALNHGDRKRLALIGAITTFAPCGTRPARQHT